MTTRITSVFVDVDGVLADWCRQLCALTGWSYTELVELWAKHDPRPWDVFAVLPLSANQGWRKIDAAGSAFWAEARLFSWAHDLLAEASRIAPVMLLTSASRHPSSYSGKAEWIDRHFGSAYPRLIGTGCKSVCAHEGSLLIDDSPKNCEAFRARGGVAILFPGLGNELHHLAHDPMPHVRQQFLELTWRVPESA